MIACTHKCSAQKFECVGCTVQQAQDFLQDQKLLYGTQQCNTSHDPF